MNIQNLCTFIVIFGILTTPSGCMTIKDTAGIKQYLQDQGRAEILALDIKTKNPDKSSEKYQKAESLFNRAAGLGNGWTKGVVFDARLKREVDVPVTKYQSSEAGKSIGAFLALDSSIKPMFDPVTGAAIATFVLTVVDMIEKQSDKRVETAVQTIESEFKKAEWTTFQLTTIDWITQKYGTPKQ